MEFKWIQDDDIKMLSDIIEKQGWSHLPSGSLAFVAFDDEGIAGFHILQVRPHAEPLWVREDLEGTGLSIELAKGMEAFLRETNTQGFIAIADTPEAVKLCEAFGMRRVTNPVYIR